MNLPSPPPIEVSGKAALIVLIWIATIIFVRYFGRFMKRVEQLGRIFDIDNRTFKAIDNILDTIAVILALGMSLSVLGITGVLYTTLTAFGVIGIIIGIAVKDLASNLFAGVMMIFTPSFLVDEFIEVDGISGTVEKISLRMTILRRADGVLITVPNTLFITKPVINFSAAERRRIEIKVGVANENDIEEALRLMRTAAEKHEHTLPRESIDVVMTDVKDYAVDLTLRFWVHPDHLRSSTSEILKDITRRFKGNDVELAVPLRKNI